MIIHNFDGSISRDALHAVLSRAISYCDALTTTSLDDDLRLLEVLQPTFIGRVSFPWEPTAWTAASDAGKGGSEFEALQFSRGSALTKRIHGILPNTFCQAVIWEGIYPSINSIPIPEWVFKGLGRIPEKRTFRYEDMFGADFDEMYQWDEFGEGCRVFDLTKPESQLWIYYRACRYIDAGFEALHMGQPHKYAAKDHRYQILSDIFDLIRVYARQNARRGIVLIDAHTHGIARDGHLLFDFHAKPMSARVLREFPERIVLHLKGGNLGGITPSGWYCNSLPFLVEIDNWGGYSLNPDQWDDLDKRAAHGKWGWDDISWFAHQSRQERAHFLQYAHHWARLQGPDAFFQMPVRRTLDRAAIMMRGFNGETKWVDKYHANTPSVDAPFGFGDESAIVQTWQESSPVWLDEWHWSLESQTGGDQQDIAQPVVIVGPLQSLLGGIVGESFCPFSRLIPTGNDVFERAFVIPWAGKYEFSLSVGGTMTDVTNYGGFTGGAPYHITTTRDNEIIRLKYRHWSRELIAENGEGRVIPLA